MVIFDTVVSLLEDHGAGDQPKTQPLPKLGAQASILIEAVIMH